MNAKAKGSVDHEWNCKCELWMQKHQQHPVQAINGTGNMNHDNTKPYANANHACKSRCKRGSWMWMQIWGVDDTTE